MRALTLVAQRRFDHRLQRARNARLPAENAREPDEAPKPMAAEASPGRMRLFFIALFIIVACLPLSGGVGSVRLAPATFYLLIGFLPICFVWLVRRRSELGPADLCIWGFWLWASLALAINGGLSASIEPIGLQLLQTVGAFGVGRVLVRDARSARFMILSAVAALVIATPFAVYEFVTGKPLLLELLSQLGPTLPPVTMSPRLGFRRVQAFLEHPILYGVFSASVFSLAFIGLRPMRPNWRWLGTITSVANAIMSLSTGALLALNVQFGLLLWNRVLRSFEQRWKALLVLVAALYGAVDLMTTKTPFHTFVRYATFSSGSSYNRIRIWEYGTVEVGKNPFFGIGLGEWERASFMSSSMDNFWLLQAVRYGLPALALYLAVPLYIVAVSGRRKDASLQTRQLMLATNVTIVAIAISIVSVHIWNSTYVWFNFLLGCAIWYTRPARPGSDGGKVGNDEPSVPMATRILARRAVKLPSVG